MFTRALCVPVRPWEQSLLLLGWVEGFTFFSAFILELLQPWVWSWASAIFYHTCSVLSRQRLQGDHSVEWGIVKECKSWEGWLILSSVHHLAITTATVILFHSCINGIFVSERSNSDVMQCNYYIICCPQWQDHGTNNLLLCILNCRTVF